MRQDEARTSAPRDDTIYVDDYCPMESWFIAEDGVCLEFGEANATAEITFSDDSLLRFAALLDEILKRMLLERNILVSRPRC